MRVRGLRCRTRCDFGGQVGLGLTQVTRPGKIVSSCFRHDDVAVRSSRVPRERIDRKIGKCLICRLGRPSGWCSIVAECIWRLFVKRESFPGHRRFSLSMFRCWIREACRQAKLWPRCARKPGDACEASLFSSDRFIVGSSCNASYNAFTSGFISTAICNQNGDSELTSIGQGDKPYVVGGGGDPSMSPGTASLVCEKSTRRKSGA